MAYNGGIVSNNQALHHEAIQLLRKLVSFRTIQGADDQLTDALSYVAAHCKEAGLNVRYITDSSTTVMVAATRNIKEPMVAFVHHIDVVPTEDPADWEIQERDGRLYGRGVYDMKFAIAASLTAIKYLQKPIEHYNFAIIITTDEETVDRGAQLVLDNGYKPKMVVVMDGGQDWNVEVAAKGAWTVELIARGVTAHGSRPWEGDSASMKLLDALDDIRNYFQQVDDSQATINISRLSAGSAPNQVPDSASATLDMRIADAKMYQLVRRHLRAVCKDYGVSYNTTVYFPPLEHDTQHPLVVSALNSIAARTGVRDVDFVSTGANDSVHFRKCDIPCLVVRPRGGGLHGPDEWIATEGLEQTHDVIGDIMRMTYNT